MIRASRLAVIVITWIGAIGVAHAVTTLPPKYAPRGPSPTAAPEIDPAGAAGALTLLAGGLAILGRRRKKD